MRVAAPKRVALALLAMAVCKSTSAPASEEEPSAIRLAALAMEGEYFEGDIITDEYPEIGRTATSDNAKLWPGGVIPYTTDAKLGRKDNLWKIRESMRLIEATTCLRFVPRKDQKDYVNIKSLRGCYSPLGRRGGEQPLSLGDGCLFLGTIVHELLHAVGFYHEHTRPDRDEYIIVFLENVIPGLVRQFTKIDPKLIRPLTPFDYNSVMLYGSAAFARRQGLLTMVTKDKRWLPPVYEKPGLSDGDVTRIKMLYNCTTQ